MKLIAKYIPVENADLGDGNSVMFKISDNWTPPCEFDCFLGPEIQSVALGKLFWCAYDFAPGDIVMEDKRFIPFEWTWMMDSNIPCENIFKVIREVTEPTIKEGDELDEDNI